MTNITAWNARLQAAVAELQARRSALISAKKRVTPMRAENRPLLCGEDGAPLARSSQHSAWKQLVAAAIGAGVIAQEDTFAMHGLKRRGISNTEGTRAEKKDASRHAREQAFAIYDDEIKVVPAPAHPIGKLARTAKKICNWKQTMKKDVAFRLNPRLFWRAAKTSNFGAESYAVGR
ncbi:hypothetical protein [Lysobacter sp. Root690]|uniref:hypothetical protein n=1 Tax=Lysobacter sp. Root690 TaxID=1736588 RepID=UPI0012FC8EC6|nr:hypothetical protein [Lysobacter sp. Root690]